MSNPAIRVEALGKSYLIGHETERERYTALRDVIASGVRRFGTSLLDRITLRRVASGLSTEEFWALKDVGFEIGHGEVVGIIGRNGAGKSTLLKILSRITEPTQGRVTIEGRVASLLEVGTGFHPELTGRENIYLNGAILGMAREEIRRKFDEIVDFAEVERFLDTPVKRYSSGMYVRLAFAVAAHLEPDILVVDEVLAVGDAEFQKKCLGKMRTVAGHGRTVLFVSHNMAAIQSLCRRAISLRDGNVVFDGDVAAAIAGYSITSPQQKFVRPEIDKDVYIRAVDGISIETDASRNRWLNMTVFIESRRAMNINADARIRDNLGFPLLYATLGNEKLESPIGLEEGSNTVRLAIDVSGLVVGSYRLSLDLSSPFVEFYDNVDDVAVFNIETHHWDDVIQPTRQEWGFGSVKTHVILK